jgi:hypothetical protein
MTVHHHLSSERSLKECSYEIVVFRLLCELLAEIAII